MASGGRRQPVVADGGRRRLSAGAVAWRLHACARWPRRGRTWLGSCAHEGRRLRAGAVGLAVVHGAVTGRLSAERARMPRLARNRRAVARRLHAASPATAPPSTAELR